MFRKLVEAVYEIYKEKHENTRALESIPLVRSYFLDHKAPFIKKVLDESQEDENILKKKIQELITQFKDKYLDSSNFIIILKILDKCAEITEETPPEIRLQYLSEISKYPLERHLDAIRTLVTDYIQPEFDLQFESFVPTENLEQLRAKKANLEIELLHTQNERDEFKTNLNEVTVKFNLDQEKIKKISDENAALKADLEAISSPNREQSDELKKLKNELQEEMKKNAELNEKNRFFVAQKSLLDREIRSLQEENLKHKTEINNLHLTIISLQETLSFTQNQHKEKHAEIQKLDHKIKLLELEIERYKKQPAKNSTQAIENQLAESKNTVSQVLIDKEKIIRERDEQKSFYQAEIEKLSAEINRYAKQIKYNFLFEPSLDDSMSNNDLKDLVTLLYISNINFKKHFDELRTLIQNQITALINKIQLGISKYKENFLAKKDIFLNHFNGVDCKNSKNLNFIRNVFMNTEIYGSLFTADPTKLELYIKMLTNGAQPTQVFEKLYTELNPLAVDGNSRKWQLDYEKLVINQESINNFFECYKDLYQQFVDLADEDFYKFINKVRTQTESDIQYAQQVIREYNNERAKIRELNLLNNSDDNQIQDSKIKLENLKKSAEFYEEVLKRAQTADDKHRLYALLRRSRFFVRRNSEQMQKMAHELIEKEKNMIIKHAKVPSSSSSITNSNDVEKPRVC